MKTNRLFSVFLAVIVVTGLLGVAPTFSARAEKDDTLKADPLLLQMAENNPDSIFMVIVQKEASNQDLKDMEVEDEILKGGGQVKKQLDLIVSFSADLTGKEILKLARHPKVRWISVDAPMVSTGTPGTETVRDEFTNNSYSGNNGSSPWSTNWTEVWDGSGTTSDTIQVVNSSACSGGSGYCLRVDPYLPIGKYIYREANLRGMVSVWLTFYRNNQMNYNFGGYYEQVQLQISPDNGMTWTTLQTYSGKNNTGAASESYDISAYAGAHTQIRFMMPIYQSGSRYIYFDDIEIAFARPSAFVSAVKANQLGTLNGQGVTVAVIDSGITTSNPDLSSNIIASAGFGPDMSTDDIYGHGTHVAGIIAGSGATSNGLYRGVAPGVNIINLKVSNELGMTLESDVIDSLQWVFNNKTTYNIRVVNLSLNSSVAQPYHTSPLDAAVEILWFNSIVVVVSAGNNGTGTGPVTLYPPANDPFVITVGATEDKGTTGLLDDNLAIFSAYGTTENGFAKPDLVAPGRNIISLLASTNSTIYSDHPAFRVDDTYFRMSGTSMAAPVVAGAVALLLQDEPNLNPDQVKYRLMATANKSWTGYNATQSGAGYIDAYAAVMGSTYGSANQGILPSQLLTTGTQPISVSVGWNTVGWNTVGWNTVGWNTVGWNTVGWNTVGWNTVGWNTVGWNTNIWGP